MARTARSLRASSLHEGSNRPQAGGEREPTASGAGLRVVDDRAAGCVAVEATEQVRAAVRRRIGPERFSVWFTEGAAIEVLEAPSGSRTVRVVVGGAFARQWLERSFHPDLVAAAREVIDGSATVEWVTAVPECVPEGLPAGGSAAVVPEVGGITPAANRGALMALAPPGDERRSVAPIPRDAAIGVGRPVEPGRAVPGARLAEFVVGAGNRMAWTAVEMALARPGQVSPLVIVGPGGCGKTHLVDGLCERVRHRAAVGAVVAQTAEQFTTAFLQALHGGQAAAFRRTCRAAELFAIDDLQFFAGRNARATVTELCHTIDALLRRGRQVVLVADRDPDTITELGADLQARLRGGISARIQPADEASRRGIVVSLAARRGLELPDDVVAFVATRLVRHSRELVGAVNRLEAASKMLGMPIDVGLAEEALADLIRSCHRGVRIADVDRAVCTALGLAPGALQARSRGRAVNHPRMLAMFLARRHTAAPLTEIGGYFGRRSHSTVLSAHKTVAAWLATDRPLMLADATWRVADVIRRVEDLLLVG